jgi:hypothetical protein
MTNGRNNIRRRIRDGIAEPAPTASGRTVREWTESGRSFRIEKLAVPKLVGASERHFRLYDDGVPATGGQYHCTEEDALRRAAYVLETDYVKRISFLENQVNMLQTQLQQSRLRVNELEASIADGSPTS